MERLTGFQGASISLVTHADRRYAGVLYVERAATALWGREF